MSRGTHKSPQRTKTNKSKKSQNKLLKLVNSNQNLLKSLQNG